MSTLPTKASRRTLRLWLLYLQKESWSGLKCTGSSHALRFPLFYLLSCHACQSSHVLVEWSTHGCIRKNGLGPLGMLLQFVIPDPRVGRGARGRRTAPRAMVAQRRHFYPAPIRRLVHGYCWLFRSRWLLTALPGSVTTVCTCPCWSASVNISCPRRAAPRA